MGLSYEHVLVGSKILAKIKIYTLDRAELLIILCYEIPCSMQELLIWAYGLSKIFLPMKISKRLLVAELSNTTHHQSTTYQAVPGRAPAPLYDCQFTTCSQFHTLLSILLTHCVFTEKFRKFRIKCKRGITQREQILCNSRELWFMHIWLEVCTMYVR